MHAHILHTTHKFIQTLDTQHTHIKNTYANTNKCMHTFYISIPNNMKPYTNI